jgi:ABC-2 type transport system ATP-binding protein
MLELRNVTKRFPGTIAVDNVSFSARAGEITGYLGPNGSGKSTTMKMISGLEHLAMVSQLRGLPAKPAANCMNGVLRLFSLHLIPLDEPFSGLDVDTALVLRSLIQELAARGKVVLFSPHELETVERVSLRVVILHRGRLSPTILSSACEC